MSETPLSGYAWKMGRGHFIALFGYILLDLGEYGGAEIAGVTRA
jgi:hypothetical protein